MATLGTLATPIVVTATPETTAARAAQMMREHHIGSLVVIDAGSASGKPVVFVTDRDLVLAVMAEELDPALFTVGDVMSVDLVTAPASTDLLDATSLLRQHRLRRLIVLDDEASSARRPIWKGSWSFAPSVRLPSMRSFTWAISPWARTTTWRPRLTTTA